MKLRFGHRVVTEVHGHILGFGQRRQHVQCVEMVIELDQFAEVLFGSGPAAAFKVRCMWRAGAGKER